jgi:hypothetical protein
MTTEMFDPDTTKVPLMTVFDEITTVPFAVTLTLPWITQVDPTQVAPANGGRPTHAEDGVDEGGEDGIDADGTAFAFGVGTKMGGLDGGGEDADGALKHALLMHI